MLSVGLVTAFYCIAIFSVLGHSILIMISFTLELYRESERCEREYKPQLKTGAEVSKTWWWLAGLAFNGDSFFFVLMKHYRVKCLQRKTILIRHRLMSALFSNGIMIYIMCDPSSCSTYRFKACLYFLASVLYNGDESVTKFLFYFYKCCDFVCMCTCYLCMWL